MGERGQNNMSCDHFQKGVARTVTCTYSTLKETLYQQSKVPQHKEDITTANKQLPASFPGGRSPVSGLSTGSQG